MDSIQTLLSRKNLKRTSQIWRLILSNYKLFLHNVMLIGHQKSPIPFGSFAKASNKIRRAKTRQLREIHDNSLPKPKQAYNLFQRSNCAAYTTAARAQSQGSIMKNSKKGKNLSLRKQNCQLFHVPIMLTSLKRLEKRTKIGILHIQVRWTCKSHSFDVIFASDQIYN